MKRYWGEKAPFWFKAGSAEAKIFDNVEDVQQKAIELSAQVEVLSFPRDPYRAVLFKVSEEPQE